MIFSMSVLWLPFCGASLLPMRCIVMEGEKAIRNRKDSSVPQNGFLYKPWLLSQVLACPVLATLDMDSLFLFRKCEHLNIARLISQSL